MKKTFWKKSVSLLLALMMLLGTLPVQAFATQATVIRSAEDFPSTIPAGAVYELADDITLSADQQISKLEGTLDGKGHTITVAGKALANEVTGTIQNLGVASSAAIGGVGGVVTSNGSMATTLHGGTILNSFSTATLTDMFDDMGGLVGQSIGGTIRNSFFAGSISGYLYGGLVGRSTTEDQPSTITECYYTVGEHPVSMGTHYNKAEGRFAKKSVEDMKSAAFVELLNQDIQPTGFQWAAVPGELPRLAAMEPSEPANPQIRTAEDLPETIPADVTYELAGDITLNPGQQIAKIEGVLDGKGYTITVADQALANEVTGTIQNLGVASSAAIGGVTGLVTCNGSMATTLHGGTILNCFSTAQLTDMFDDMGGLVGQSIGGTIRNSFFAGKISGYMYGGLIGRSTTAEQPSTITECYYTVGDLPVSMGTYYNKDEGRFAKKDEDAMKSADFVELLNKDIQPTGFQWAAVPGALPQLAATEGGAVPDVPTLSTAALENLIAEVEALRSVNFTEDSWKNLTSALEAAKETLDQENLTQEQVNSAYDQLAQARNELEKVLPTQPVPAPESGVIEISSASQLNGLQESDTRGKFYRLTQDIEMTDLYWFGPQFAGVLDGDGHTITNTKVSSPMFERLTADGVIQNVNFEGKTDQEIAPVRNLQGAIINCRTSVSGKDSGFAVKMDGGVISNSISVGQPEKGAFVQKYVSGTVVNSFWPARIPSSIPAEALVGSAAKSDKEMKTTAMRDQLNAGRGELGTQWGQGSDGYPYFGKDMDYTPEGGFQSIYPVSFTAYTGEKDENNHFVHGETIAIGKDNSLTLNPDAGIEQGIFSLEGVPSGSTITWSCDDSNKNKTMAINRTTGEYHVYQAGDAVVTATERTASGETRKVAEILVSSVRKNLEELHLLVDGRDVTNGKLTVAGSELKRVQAYGKYEGEDELVRIGNGLNFTTEESDKLVLQQSTSGVFSFQRPGTATMTVTKGAFTASVEITSTYVPVTSIVPAISGSIELHGKNSMYYGYNTLETQVIYQPANASYTRDYTVASSDEDIAYFQSGMVLGYIAKKAGDVTFTASVVNRDPETGETEVIQGSSDVHFYYKNPLKEVTGPGETVQLTAYEAPQKMDLHFVGTQPIPEGYQHGYAVTETRLNWTFEGEGAVSITYPNEVMQIRGIEYPDGGNWVSSTEYFVQGTRPGTVTAIGTPVDDTAGAKPVRITFQVAPGEAPEALDIAKFVAEAKEDAAGVLLKNLHYEYTSEWDIFTLLRAGEQLPQEELDRYYDSVVATVKNWKTSQKPTDIARVILPLSIMGRDITDVGGVDLAAMLYNHSRLDMGSNEVAWALIALDATDVKIPESAKYDRPAMVELLLTFQNEDGGFGLGKGTASGPDTTAMALQALAPYQEKNEAAIEMGLGYLKTIHTEAKHFDSGTSEANAQTILALSVLGRDLASEPGFSSPVYNLMTAMNDYFVAGEGFKHDKGMKVNAMATVQAMQALDAYDRFANGKSAYWDLTDKEPVDPQPAYEFISGANQKITQGSIPAAVVLELTGDVKNFQSVSVNDTVLDAKNYTVDENAVTIRIQKAWLETLEAGTYKITVSFTDGAASTRLYVEEAPVLPNPDQKITVSFTLLGDEHHGEDVVHTYRYNHDELPVWMETQDFTVPAGSMAADVFEMAMDQAGYSYKLAFGGNYISEINGLAEFDNGPNSGWMYLLNGSIAKLGVAEQAVADGDVIIMYYTDDYTLEDPGQSDDPAALAVRELIEQIGTVTEQSGEAIQAARDAYDALTPAQKSQVSNYETLAAAEKAYAKLTASEADRKAAQQVEELIGAIGTVTLDSAKKIDAARKAYDKLSGTQKELVENYGKLTAAEAKLAQLQGPSHKEMYETVGHSLEAMAQQSVPMVGSVGGEWLVLGLLRSGLTIPADAYYKNVVDFVVNNINDAEQLHRAKSTENARIILALTAMGKDVTDVAGHNLLMGLTDMKYVQRQGINGPIWALIAFDSHGYEIPVNPAAKEQVSREALIEAILAAQLPDGGWDLAHTSADSDMTGMALQALAPYYETNEAVKAAVDKAIVKLSEMQDENGLFSSIDGASVEASAQVIVALTALGIDPHTDARFVKNGISAVDGLCAFTADDGFSHVLGTGRDQMATEQAYYALTAYFRFVNGETALYDMSDVTIGETGTPDGKPEQPEVDPEDKPDTKPDSQEKPSVPDVEEDTQTQEKPEMPETGDGSEIAFFTVTMTISLLATAAFFSMKKRENF